ncbi:hypothetical protein BH23BAC3_BH23BAC3_17450 [soil metagenome]
MTKIPYYLLYLLIVVPFVMACSGSEKVTTERVEHDTQTSYLSATGSDFMRNEIKKGIQSVKRLHNTVIYRTYLFDVNDLPTHVELTDTEFRLRAVQTRMDHQSNAGSALILKNSGGISVLLTASHTVTFPDTVWHYVEYTGPEPNHEVEAVSVRETLSHYLIGSHGVYDFEVEVNDPTRDLAFLSVSWDHDTRPRLSPLELQAGRSRELDWTDQVYAIGFPQGTEMVTRAMVSISGNTPRRSFVLDASFNRGFSGGAIFAERGDGAGMEWVGMVSSASAEREEYLVPERIYDEEFRPELEYTGAIYARRSQRINYGITYAVGIDHIKDFYNENRNELRRRGITLPAFE